MDQAVAAALTEREEQQDKQQSLQITSDNLLDTHRPRVGNRWIMFVGGLQNFEISLDSAMHQPHLLQLIP
jgi:hypothetical protein